MRYMRIQIRLEPYIPVHDVVSTEEYGTVNGRRGDRTIELNGLEDGASLADFAYDYNFNF